MHKIKLTKHWAILVTRGKRPRFYKYHNTSFLRFIDVGPVRLIQFKH